MRLPNCAIKLKFTAHFRILYWIPVLRDSKNGIQGSYACFFKQIALRIYKIYSTVEIEMIFRKIPHFAAHG